MSPGCEIDQIGIRPGEKLHECLISEDEARQAVIVADRYIILPAQPWWACTSYDGAKNLDDGFSYSSDNNTEWLNKAELLEMIDEHP